MSATDFLGYLASSAVLMTFLMTRMGTLRAVAIASNILFIAYGYAQHIYPVLALHMILLPVNVWRLMSINGSAPAASIRQFATPFAVGVLATMLSVGVTTMMVAEYVHATDMHRELVSLSRAEPMKSVVHMIHSAEIRLHAVTHPGADKYAPLAI